MAQRPVYAPRPAVALIALARAMMLDETVQESDVAGLIGAICADRGERTALLNALSDANSVGLARAVAGLLADFVADRRETETGLADLDDVAGVWGMRICTGGLLLGVGAALTGTLTGGAAILAILAASIGGLGVGAGRLTVRKRVNALVRQREIAQRLCDDVETLAQAK